MTETVVAAFDIASRRTGWCVGSPFSHPKVGCWDFPAVGDDLGLLGLFLAKEIRRLFAEHEVTHVIYEAPIMLRFRDRVSTLRKLYGMGFLLETLCAEREAPCVEADLKALKKELAGFGRADKSDMVAAAEKAGIVLPLGDGAQDAADAFAAWLVWVRCYAKPALGVWDARLYGQKGRLL